MDVHTFMCVNWKEGGREGWGGLCLVCHSEVIKVRVTKFGEHNERHRNRR